MTATCAARPSLADLFITNLRLLDLHHRPDWPSLTPNLYAVKDLLGQNQKTRIRCTEWALYRLFEFWDVQETHNKLQPFFPVLEPLQSINLRAAIFRWLSELKKNGHLGRETIVRKTMLDECKGEKFLEILVAFSTAVVRKIVLSPSSLNNGLRQSLALKYAQDPTLSAQDCTALEPLCVVYQTTLSACLREKTDIRVKCVQFAQQLDQKHQQLLQRAALCNGAAAAALPAEDAMKSMEKHIKDNWPGNSRWPSALLYGDDVNPGDQPLKRPFARVWDSVIHDEQLKPDVGDVGLKQNLEQRVMQQQARLQNWRAFYTEMSQREWGGSRKRPFEPPSQSTAFDFTRHSELRLRSRSDTISDEPKIRTVSNRRLAAILDDLRQELNAAAHPAPQVLEAPAEMVPEVIPRSRTYTLASEHADVARPMVAAHTRALSANLGPARSSTAVPLSRVFSPAKKFRVNARSISTTSNDSTTSSSTTNLSMMEKPVLAERTEPTPPPTPKVVQRGYDSAQEEDTASIVSDAAAVDADSLCSPVEADGADHALTLAMTAFSPLAGPGMSLAERTRQSMSQLQSGPSSTTSQLRPFLARTAQQDPHPAAAIIAHGMVAERRTSLLQRTQQSMTALAQQVAAATTASDAPSNPRHSLSVRKNRNSTAAFPVNQFETPGRSRPAPMRDATPTERLFSEEAEYASVFRSRPRVALSPQPSPDDAAAAAAAAAAEDGDGGDWPLAPAPSMGMAMGMAGPVDGVIYEESEESSMMEDVDGDSWVRSSPLRGRG